MTNRPFDFNAADAISYHLNAQAISKAIWGGYFQEVYHDYVGKWYDISDRGYFIYLSFLYALLFNSILLVRIVKALLSAWTCVLIYRLAKRNFGEQSGRLSGIMAMLLPNFIFYCGIHLKETEMVFLIVAFIERCDYIIRSNRIDIKSLAIIVLLGVALFTFRTVLAISAFFAFLTALIFTNTRIIGWGKKIIIISLLFLTTFLFVSDSIKMDISRYYNERMTNQENSMQWRSERHHGNYLARYGKASLFAPVILLVPFPTMVNIEYQQNIMMLSGAYFTRNIYAFFIIIGIIQLIKKKLYKNHILLLAFTFMYLAILTLSAFALSERYHLPVLPFLIIIAGYGITNMSYREVRYFPYYLIVISLLIIGWNWFKLAGRGLI